MPGVLWCWFFSMFCSPSDLRLRKLSCFLLSFFQNCSRTLHHCLRESRCGPTPRSVSTKCEPLSSQSLSCTKTIANQIVQSGIISQSCNCSLTEMDHGSPNTAFTLFATLNDSVSFSSLSPSCTHIYLERVSKPVIWWIHVFFLNPSVLTVPFSWLSADVAFILFVPFPPLLHSWRYVQEENTALIMHDSCTLGMAVQCIVVVTLLLSYLSPWKMYISYEKLCISVSGSFDSF